MVCHSGVPNELSEFYDLSVTMVLWHTYGYDDDMTVL